MREPAELDRLLTQVNCRITSIIRLRDAAAISERKAEQELKQAVAFRAELMQQIEGQNLPLTPRTRLSLTRPARDCSSPNET